MTVPLAITIISLPLHLFTGDRVAHLTREPRPRRLLRHPERTADLRPAMAGVSRLAHCLPNRLRQRRLGSAALAERVEWPRVPVSDGVKSEPAFASGDPHCWRAAYPHQGISFHVASAGPD